MATWSILLATGAIVITYQPTKIQAATTKITAIGSTALQPLVEQAANQYQAENPDVTITVQGGGSGTGLAQVQAGAVEIGNSDIFASQQTGIKAEKLTDHKVAVVGMAPVVNKNVGVKSVTMKQLQGIFTGKITNWKEVGGKDQAIIVVNRAKGSGTRTTFESIVLKGKKAVAAQEQDSSGTVEKMVATTPGAISYLAFSYLDGAKIQPLAINKVAPSEKNVQTNKWKIWSYEHMYTPKKASKQTKAFIKYMKSKAVQTKLVKKLGYISVDSMKVQKDAHNQVRNK